MSGKDGEETSETGHKPFSPSVLMGNEMKKNIIYMKFNEKS
jgi:hypothetical protein